MSAMKFRRFIVPPGSWPACNLERNAVRAPLPACRRACHQVLGGNLNCSESGGGEFPFRSSTGTVPRDASLRDAPRDEGGRGGLLRRTRGQEFGRGRNELLHPRLRVVAAHVLEPQAVDARVLILVLDLVAALACALRHRRLVPLRG